MDMILKVVFWGCVAACGAWGAADLVFGNKRSGAILGGAAVFGVVMGAITPGL